MQVNLLHRVITVGRAKTSNGTGRVIPINDELAQILLAHRVWFAGRFDQPGPDQFVFATGLAENGTPESTMLSLLGHMSRSILERYSHIRMAAKRDAVSSISLRSTKRLSEVVPVEVPVAERLQSVQ
jgi:hypothetical protein